MPANYNGDPSSITEVSPVTITEPVNGDDLTAESVDDALEGLADYIAFLFKFRGGRNLLLNGDFAINQRFNPAVGGAIGNVSSFNLEWGYLLDRWYGSVSNGATFPGSIAAYSAGGGLVISTAGGATQETALCQVVPDPVAKGIFGANKKITVAFKMRRSGVSSIANVRFKVGIYSGQPAWRGLGETVLGETAYAAIDTIPADTIVTLTVNAPLTPSPISVAVVFEDARSAHGGSAVAVLSECMLTPTAAAQPFALRYGDQELAACESFFQKSYSRDVAPGTVSIHWQKFITSDKNLSPTNDWNVGTVQFRRTMQAQPVVDTYDPATGTKGFVALEGYAATTLQSLAVPTSTTGFRFGPDGSNGSNFSSGNGSVKLHWTADAEI